MNTQEIMQKNLERLTEAKNNYYKKKKALEIQRLTLKYSPEFQIYKTIKEKEERARLATQDDEYILELAKVILREAELRVEIDKVNMDFMFLEPHCCNGECNCEKSEDPNPENW